MTELHRIYQGRVNAIEIMLGHELNPVPDLERVCLEHHGLCQDAVNYYLVAMAAMASDPDSPVGKLRVRMADTWDDFARKGQLRSGMKHSLARTLGHPVPTLDSAFDEVLKGNNTDPKILQLAIDLITEKCQGSENAIKMPGPMYWARLCKVDYKGNWDCSSVEKISGEGRKRLVDALCSADPVASVAAISHELSLSWAGVKTQPGKFWEDDDAKSQLIGSIDHFLQEPVEVKNKRVNEYLAERHPIKPILDSYREKVATLEHPQFERNNRTDLNRKNALLLAKFFPDDFTIGLLKCIVSMDENRQKGKKTVADEGTPQYDLFGDDPIKLARGERGYVFPAFTCLPSFSEGGKWKELDIEAFKEALKTINQYGLKTTERMGEATRIRSRLDWMEGNRKTRPEFDGEEEEPGVLVGDPRWDRLTSVLEKDLAVANELTEGDPVVYGIHPRTVRGWGQLRGAWQNILDKKAGEPTEKVASLLNDKLVKHQSEHRDDMGSATLFRALLKPENWVVWRLPDGEEATEIQRRDWSQDVLEDAVLYHKLHLDLKDLEEPINFTPADPQLSRRIFNLSALGIGKGYGHDGKGALSCRVPMAVKSSESGQWEKKTVLVRYTAPRLLRDGLKDPDGSSVYSPPMARCLVPEPDPQDFSKCPVMLMPDWDKAGKCRILLNFPVTIAVDRMLDALGATQSKRFERQFMYANDRNTMLLWSEADGKGKATWYNDATPFHVLAVDLGQRTAGAAVRIEVSSDSPHGKYSQFLGKEGKNDWHARRLDAELLRLPGEDTLTWRGGSRQVELSGSKGRMPTPDETREAEAICATLEQDPAVLMPGGLSYPEQNDKLIVAVRRAQSRLARLNRWIWMLSEEKKKLDVQAEISKSPEYKTIPIAELPGVLRAHEAELRTVIPSNLLKVTDRILPLRGRRWQVVKHPETGVTQKTPTLLLCQTEYGTDSSSKDICGQRGLSFKRIEQLEELRKRWQSINRTMMREPGAKPESARKMRDNPIPDPCPDILRRLDAMREQRVNQTAHLILASALGIRLKRHETDAKEREKNDVHGEYEKVPRRSPVAFIAIEDLSRYLSSQGRSPAENSRLMKWCHRAVTEKIKMLAAPFGIHVVEVNAAYSSRFCSATGAPGFLATEVSAKSRVKYPWNRLLGEAESAHPSEEAKQCAQLFEMLDGAPEGMTMLAPIVGGPVFVPAAGSDMITQSDINAAFNIGLRALAPPSQLNVHQKIRAEKTKEGWVAKGNSRFDKVRFGKGKPLDYEPGAEAERRDIASKGVMNFFVDPFNVARFGSAKFADADPDIPLATGKGLWGTVKEIQWVRCMKINRNRLKDATDASRKKDKILL